MYYCNFLRNEHVRYCTFTVISCLAFHTITFKRSLLRYNDTFLHTMIKGQVKRHPLQQKCKDICKRPIVFSQRGSIQSIFVCVSKECIILERKSIKVYSRRQKFRFLQNYLFCEKLTWQIGNYQNEGVRKQILNVEGSFHSYIRIPEVMNW